MNRTDITNESSSSTLRTIAGQVQVMVTIIATISRFPQIYKIIINKSGAGISKFAIFQETISFVLNLSPPLSAKGLIGTMVREENYLYLENIIILSLLFYYDEMYKELAITFIGFNAFLAVLVNLVPMEILDFGFYVAIALTASSKLTQLRKICSNGHAGYLSLTTFITLTLMGYILILVFIIQSVELNFLFAASIKFLFNALIAFQLIAYTSATEQFRIEDRKRLKKRFKVGVSTVALMKSSKKKAKSSNSNLKDGTSQLNITGLHEAGKVLFNPNPKKNEDNKSEYSIKTVKIVPDNQIKKSDSKHEFSYSKFDFEIKNKQSISKKVGHIIQEINKY